MQTDGKMEYENNITAEHDSFVLLFYVTISDYFNDDRRFLLKVLFFFTEDCELFVDDTIRWLQVFRCCSR